MWVLFKHFIIEYSYCKIPRNSPLYENENGQISANKLERKSISFIARELLRSQKVVRNYLKDLNRMAPENVQVVHLKLQMQPDADFFEKLLKDNQPQEISKNLRIYPSLQEEFVNFSMNCQISYIKTGRQSLL